MDRKTKDEERRRMKMIRDVESSRRTLRDALQYCAGNLDGAFEWSRWSPDLERFCPRLEQLYDAVKDLEEEIRIHYERISAGAAMKEPEPH